MVNRIPLIYCFLPGHQYVYIIDVNTCIFACFCSIDWSIVSYVECKEIYIYMAFYSFYSLYKHPVEIGKNYTILKWTNVNTIYDMRGHLIMRTITRSKKGIRFGYSLFIPTYENSHNWLFMFSRWCSYILSTDMCYKNSSCFTRIVEIQQTQHGKAALRTHKLIRFEQYHSCSRSQFFLLSNLICWKNFENERVVKHYQRNGRCCPNRYEYDVFVF